MERKHENLRRRAVKAGIREARKRHHALSEDALRSVKVQVLPAWPRVLAGAAGTAMVAAAFAGWPVDADPIQILLCIGGLLLVLFATCPRIDRGGGGFPKGPAGEAA